MAEAAPKAEVRSLLEQHRDTLTALINEADGSEAGRLIARRAAALATWCDATEVLMSQGRSVDMAAYLRACATLQDLLSDAAAGRSKRTAEPNWLGDGEGRTGNLEVARRILFMHSQAKRDGKVHLLPEPVLDIIAQCRPTPEPTHESPEITQ